ncbi:MAG TPA: TonB-dependent receptor [Caulobacteraceae bacterium]
MRTDHRAKRSFTAVMLAGAGCASLLAPVWALAATAPAATAVGEVVVTARERNEQIQKVPAQVTAFTAKDIETKGIRQPADFLNAVPNVTFIATQNAGTSFIVIRGISQARNSEPSAAIVVDGVPMTQPAEFNQGLLDIQQIEVLKGPQGATYGRNAIGGAIIITTQQPGDAWHGQVLAGYEDGPGGRVQGSISGPVTDQFKIRAAVGYFNTDGHLRNVDTKDNSAKRDADPVEDFNARLTLLWQPTRNFTADLRLSTDLLNTRGLYYTVPNFGSPNFNNPNFVDQPINLNNSGKDDRKIYDVALKLNYETPVGALTSITGYSTVWEILTGDGYPFDPFGESRVGFNFDQSQFLTARTFTQELRLTSPENQRVRWIAGGEIYATDRFISTGNMFDAADEGVVPIYRHPNPPFLQTFGPQSQISYLADSQKQFAWAVYLDTTINITDRLELSLNARYDSDHRRDTTDTPQFFLDNAGIPAHTGDSRANTWNAFEPQAVLKYQFTDDISVYGSFSRGFRSGGFNQIGVATAAKAAGFDNVGDQFDAETSNTFEAGFKSRLFDRRLILNGSVYTSLDHGDYYFVFLASNSTQNLGNIQTTRFTGFDLDATASITHDLIANLGFGYTHSRIEAFPGASSALVVGAKAPLVSDYTLDAGLQYTHNVWNDWDFVLRLDDTLIGPTIFVIPVPAAGEPTPIARDPVNLFDLRVGFQSPRWGVTFWSKNLFDKRYNTEYSTGGFLFKGQPRTLGVDVSMKF